MKTIQYLLHILFAWCAMVCRTFGLLILGILCATLLPSCSATLPDNPPPLNTCDTSSGTPGQPWCLPPSGFFCERNQVQSANGLDAQPDRAYIGQLFPSKEWLTTSQPKCPPNATVLINEQDAKYARLGAWPIGHEVGRVLATCERILKELTKHPDHMLAGWNDTQPETLEAVFQKCTSGLDALPAIPAYEDPHLATAAAKGFEEGYGAGVDEVWYRLLALDMAIATIEVAIVPGILLAEVAVTRGIRASLAAVSRMPIFIPGAVGSGGAFLKSAPRVAARVVAEGSSRILGKNLKLAGLLRLPGEFAHHIVAHGDHRAKEALKILKKFGIKVDDAVNGVYLPGYKTSPNPLGKVVHGNLHTDAYYNAVEQALKGATTQAEVIRKLRFIAHQLEHGIMP